jgi:hypothetical protein
MELNDEKSILISFERNGNDITVDLDSSILVINFYEHQSDIYSFIEKISKENNINIYIYSESYFDNKDILEIRKKIFNLNKRRFEIFKNEKVGIYEKFDISLIY